MTSFGKILKSTFVAMDPFEKYLDIKGVAGLSFDEKIALLKIMQDRMEVGFPTRNFSEVGYPSADSFVKNDQKLSKIFDALVNEIYYKEHVDYEDYNLSRTIKSIYPDNKKEKKVPKLTQLHQYLGQSVWNDTIKEVDALSLPQKEALKIFIDNVLENFPVKAESDLQEKILKLKDLVRITDLQEYLSTKLVLSTTSHELTDTLQS